MNKSICNYLRINLYVIICGGGWAIGKQRRKPYIYVKWRPKWNSISSKCINQCTNQNPTSFMVENSPAEVTLAGETRRRSCGEKEQWLFALQIWNIMWRDVGSMPSRRWLTSDKWKNWRRVMLGQRKTDVMQRWRRGREKMMLCYVGD